MWFALLDQRCFTTSSGRWIAQVSGIHSNGADLWIQLASADEPLSSVLLRVTPEMTLQDAIAAVQGLISRGFDRVPDARRAVLIPDRTAVGCD